MQRLLLTILIFSSIPAWAKHSSVESAGKAGDFDYLQTDNAIPEGYSAPSSVEPGSLSLRKSRPGSLDPNAFSFSAGRPMAPPAGGGVATGAGGAGGGSGDEM